MNSRAHHYANVVHPFLSVFVPFWFVITTIVVMVNSAVVQSGVYLFPPFFTGLLLLVGVSETITGNLLYKQRIAGFIPRLREFVFVVLLGFFFILLLHGEISRRNLNIGRIKIWLPMVVLATEWIMSYYIHQKLRERELFLNFFEGVPEKLVRESYNTHMHEGGESAAAIKSVKRLVVTLTVLGFLLLNIMSWGFRFRFTGMSLFIIIVFFGGNLLIVSVLRSWTDSQFMLMDGLVVTKGQHRFRLALTIMLCLALLVVAIPATGSRPLLPESYITAFATWLQSIGRFEPPDLEVKPPELGAREDEMQLPPQSTSISIGGENESRSLANLTRIIGWILLVGLSIGTVVFLFRPIFRIGSNSPGQIIARMVKSIGNAASQFRKSLQVLFEAIRNRQRLREWDKIGGRRPNPISAGQLRRRARRNLKGGSRPTSRVLKDFFRFTKWGERRGIPFQKTMGAHEYALKLASVSADLANECVEIAGIFEEVMYSNHRIEESTWSTFRTKIRQLVKTK